MATASGLPREVLKWI